MPAASSSFRRAVVACLAIHYIQALAPYLSSPSIRLTAGADHDDFALLSLRKEVSAIFAATAACQPAKAPALLIGRRRMIIGEDIRRPDDIGRDLATRPSIVTDDFALVVMRDD